MKKKIIIIFTVMILILGGISYWYVSDYYHVNPDIIQKIQEDDTIQREKDYLVFDVENPKAGLIFYPGAKVQFEAYTPLMDALKEHGILCILYHMPANLAILNQDIAKGIQEQYPEIQDWYIGGHSLGGVCASNYLYNHQEEFAGLILLASYSTKDFSSSSLKAISIYGSNDGVLNLEKYKDAFKNLPPQTMEYIIDGGNHANFGDYGIQKKDNSATIDQSIQIEQTTSQIIQFISN